MNVVYETTISVEDELLPSLFSEEKVAWNSYGGNMDRMVNMCIITVSS